MRRDQDPTRTPWQSELREALTTPLQLHAAGLLSAAEAADPRLAALIRENQVRVTRHYASLVDREDPRCPIRLQAVPSLAHESDPELPAWLKQLSSDLYGQETPWRADAIGDLHRLAAPRLTHRYGNRALLHVSDHCAVWCRFCFRKSHLNEREEALYAGRFDEALEYLAKTPAITELILTGGDPLSLGDEPLERLLARLESVPHLRNVRIHTRMGVTLPARITPKLATLLGRARRYHLAIAHHFNHPRELCGEAIHALALLRRAGITLLNQSVLLRGVNDRSEILIELFQSLYRHGVIPFWLHHPDWTPATFGFRVSMDEGLALYRGLLGRLSGPALPHYVLDLPTGLGKAPLNDSRVRKIQEIRRDGYQAAIYEIPRPTTQAETGDATVRYLDLRALLPELTADA